MNRKDFLKSMGVAIVGVPVIAKLSTVDQETTIKIQKNFTGFANIAGVYIIKAKSDKYCPVGSICVVYDPKREIGNNWLICDGGKIPSRYRELNKVLGKKYGGKLPDLRGIIKHG